METRVLGSTGVSVSSLALGSMMFGPTGNADREECLRMIHRALDAGITLIDTADVYSRGESERIVGAALAGRRDDVVLATKFNAPMDDGANSGGNSRRWIMRAVEDSLRRLDTDYLDLYQVHRPDPTTAFDETLSALSDLVRAGKIRYIGTSTFSAAQIVEGQWTAERRNLERVVCEQPPYSILTRGVEAEILPLCADNGMGVLVWGPLAGGWLSGRAQPASPGSTRSTRFPGRWDLGVPANAAKLAAVDALTRLAEECGLTLIELALAFVREHPAVTAALIGPRTLAQLESQLSAADVRLDDDVLDRIDDIVPPGTTLNEADLGIEVPGLSDLRLRRRRNER
jgi:aryl-alcohol dehydrogenase-like predicted oxidoreductase